MPSRIKGLADLAPLRESLQKKTSETRAQEQREKKIAIEQKSAADEFRDFVGTVTPLATPTRVRHARAPHPPIAKQRLADEREALVASVSDEFEIDTLLQVDEELSFRRPGVGGDVLRKLRRGDWVIQDELDLHGARVAEAREMLAGFLRDALRRGLRCVRIVHGKGLGSRNRQPVLRGKTRNWLVQREEVIAFCQARPDEGGSGALMVLLRPATG